MNLTSDQEKLLNSRLSDLQFSENFIHYSQTMGLTSLKEITDLGWTRVTQLDGFSNMWFAELITMLNREGLLSLLYQREQGISD